MVGQRFRSLLGLAVARIRGRLRIAPQRVLLSVVGVALAIGLMVSVTGVSLGLASQSVVQSDGVDYWIIPEQATVESIAVSTGGPRLSDVHTTTREIESDERVTYVTPVLLELLPVRDAETGERTFVLAAGIIPARDQSVLGLPAGQLEPGDPFYADGNYDGRLTNEVVINEAAATLTNTSTGEEVNLDGSEVSMTVINVSEGGTETAAGSVPLMLVHLSELQALTGSAVGDSADQLLVSTNDASVRSSLEDRYPQTTVVTRSGFSTQQASASSLPLAVAVAALVSALIVGVLFITTLMGLEVSADRRQLGALSAIGFADRSLSLLVAAETITLSILGGLLGVVVGFGGITAANALSNRLFGVEQVALFEPWFAGYALAVAISIGLFGTLYPVWLSRRTDVQEVLS